MNKAIISVMLLILSATSYSQQISSSETLYKEDYLQKSKHQKTAAWVLLGGGFGLTALSAIIATPKVTEDYAGIFTGLFYDEPVPENSYTAETILLITGSAAMFSSIPLFIASGKNKRKAMSLSFKKETVSQIQKSSFVYRSVPSLTLKINL